MRARCGGVSTTLLMGAGISYWNEILQANKYGVLVNSLGGYKDIPHDNKYALVLDGEIGDDAKKAMVVGFIHGMAVGRKKAKEVANEETMPRNQNYQRTNYGYGF